MTDFRLTPEDIVWDTLSSASASGMTLTDCVRLLEHAHCIQCWSEAVNLFAMEGIDVEEVTMLGTGPIGEYFNTAPR
jgi:hypothetical protein